MACIKGWYLKADGASIKSGHNPVCLQRDNRKQKKFLIFNSFKNQNGMYYVLC